MGNPLLDISANVKVKPSCKSFWECCAWEQEIWNRKLHYYLLILFHSQSCWRSTVGRLTMPFSPRRKLSLRSWRSTRFDTSRYRWCLHPLHVGHRSGWSHCWWSYSELNQGGTVAPGWTSNDDFEMFWNGATCFVWPLNYCQANPELCSYMGCVGKDDSSKILAEKVFWMIFFIM